MKVIVDVMHIPHINFLKNAVAKLKNEGVDVKVICLDRGKNILIAKEEFVDVEVIKIGVHKGTFFSIIFQANVLRFFSIFKHLLTNKYDKGLSVGSFLLGFGLKFFRKPNLQFYDDPENKKNLFFQKITANKLFYPSFFKSEGIENFNALKEWAYLSPKYFKPDKSVLKEYDLMYKEYIFVREVKYSTNYSDQAADLISLVSKKFPRGIKVVMSLESKDKAQFYPNDWVILKEPVSDIHSLIYYSKIIVSSGDSMAREGAMLGVPSVYCGVRDMKGNNVMKEKGTLFHVDINDLPLFLEKVVDKEIEVPDQTEFRESLVNEWDDVTEIIVSNILKLKK